MLRNEHLFELDAIGAAGAHAKREIAAPVRQHGQLRARHNENERARRSILAQHHVADEMRRIGNAGAVVPGTVDHIAAFGALAGAGDRADPVRRDEVARGPEQLVLSALRPMRRDQ